MCLDCVLNLAPLPSIGNDCYLEANDQSGNKSVSGGNGF